MSVLETLAMIGAISEGAAGVGSFISGLYGGAKAAEEAEKAQAWNEKTYADQLRQQTIQNQLQEEQLGLTKASQHFNQALARRNEARQDKAIWNQTMQTARNKYAEILNSSRTLRKDTAAAFRNR